MKVSYGLTFRYTAQNFKIFKIESKSLLTYFLSIGLVKVAGSCKRIRWKVLRRQIYISKPNSTMLLNGRRKETLQSEEVSPLKSEGVT